MADTTDAAILTIRETLARGLTPMRTTMAAADDVFMLTEVIFSKPWEASRYEKVEAWDAIAERLKDLRGFGVNKDGPAIRKRVSALVKRFREDEFDSMRRSGTPEEYDEVKQLLTDVVSRMDDYESSEEVRTALAAKKKAGIISSGELIRKLALGATTECDDGYLVLDAAAATSATSSTAPAATLPAAGPAPASATKRKATPAAGKSKAKRSKRESLDIAMSGIVQGIAVIKQSDSDNAAVQRERLEFDREQAAIAQARHEASQATITSLLAELAAMRKN
jgi:hypothetical protein